MFISGIVTDANEGRPLIGVSIQAKALVLVQKVYRDVKEI